MSVPTQSKGPGQREKKRAKNEQKISKMSSFITSDILCVCSVCGGQTRSALNLTCDITFLSDEKKKTFSVKTTPEKRKNFKTHFISYKDTKSI